jgi:hypothetical protein
MHELLPSKEHKGAGNPGCALHPRPRVQQKARALESANLAVGTLSLMSRAALFARDHFCNSLTLLKLDSARCEESPWLASKRARVSD